jgi:ATP-dependent Clp protease ATP-binding subunit ClpA
MNGYNFTERVRKVLSIAREEALRLQNEYVAPEHIMLGLLREGEGVANVVLERCGVDVDTLGPKIEALAEPPASRPALGPDLPYASRAKRTLELSMSEARELGHSYVGTEHLLMGLVRDDKNKLVPVLKELGLTVDRARAAIVEILGDTNVISAPGSRDDLIGMPLVPNAPERLRLVMATAYSVAGTLGATELSPVHAALALLQHRDGAGNAALDSLRINRDAITEALQQAASLDKGPEISPEVRVKVSGALQAVLLRLHDEQRALGSAAPGTQHLLLALLGDKQVADSFAQQGLRVERVRDEVRRLSG